MPNWRTGWPPMVGRWRDDQIANQNTWEKVGTAEDWPMNMHVARITTKVRGATTETVVNPVDPGTTGAYDIPPGKDREHGRRPIPAGRY